MARFLPLICLMVAGCSYSGGVGGSAYAPGLTRDDVRFRMDPAERVRFQSRDMMIVEDVRTGRTQTLRFGPDGRLDAAFPRGGWRR